MGVDPPATTSEAAGGQAPRPGATVASHTVSAEAGGATKEAAQVADASKTPPPPENREHLRREFAHALVVSELDERDRPGPGLECRGVDISRSGMGIRARRMIHDGRRLLILVRSGEAARALYGVVQRSRYDDKGMYVIGVQFAAVPESLAIREWLDEHTGRRAGVGSG